MGKRPFTMIASIIFAIMAVIHGFRLARHFQIVVGSHDIPNWVSWIGLVIPAILAWGTYRESRR